MNFFSSVLMCAPFGLLAFTWFCCVRRHLALFFSVLLSFLQEHRPANSLPASPESEAGPACAPPLAVGAQSIPKTVCSGDAMPAGIQVNTSPAPQADMGQAKVGRRGVQLRRSTEHKRRGTCQRVVVRVSVNVAVYIHMFRVPRMARGVC